MPRYLEVAAEANKVAKELMQVIGNCDRGPLSQEDYGRIAELIARLVNYGIRCSPRAVMGTVRLNAVKRAVQDLPVKVWMEERKDEHTGRTYKVLCTVPEGGKVTVENATGDEE